MSDIYLIPPHIRCPKCNAQISIRILGTIAYGDDLICVCGEIIPASYYGKFLGKITNVGEE